MAQIETPLETIAAKAALRNAGRQCRAALSAAERAEKSRQVCDRLLLLWSDVALRYPKRAPQPVAVYLANETEANVDEFAHALLHRGLSIAAPRLSEEPPFYALQSTLSNVATIQVESHRSALREPQPFEGGRAFEPREIGILVVPGVAFDRRGGRIGQGGGWYDKVLMSAPDAIVIGVGFDCQLIESVPQQGHDRAMHYIVTESQVWQTGAPISPP